MSIRNFKGTEIRIRIKTSDWIRIRNRVMWIRTLIETTLYHTSKYIIPIPTPNQTGTGERKARYNEKFPLLEAPGGLPRQRDPDSPFKDTLKPNKNYTLIISSSI
jgi:hypothetical protein